MASSSLLYPYASSCSPALGYQTAKRRTCWGTGISVVMSSSGSGSAATGVGVGGRQPVSSDRLNIAAAAVAKTDGRRGKGAPIAPCYENVRGHCYPTEGWNADLW